MMVSLKRGLVRRQKKESCSLWSDMGWAWQCCKGQRSGRRDWSGYKKKSVKRRWVE